MGQSTSTPVSLSCAVPGSVAPVSGSYRRALGGARNWGPAGWGLRRGLYAAHPELPRRVIRAAVASARGVAAALGLSSPRIVGRLAQTRLSTPSAPVPAVAPIAVAACSSSRAVGATSQPFPHRERAGPRVLRAVRTGRDDPVTPSPRRERRPRG